MDRYSFIVQKAENFKSFVLGQSPDPELVAQMEQLDKGTVIPALTSHFLPAIAAKGIPALVDDIIVHLKPDDEAAVRAKLVRYVECFRDALTQ